MKKSFLISLLILLLTSSAGAAELDRQKLEFAGGFSYNNYIHIKYNLREIDGSLERKKDENYFVREELHRGIGYYTELIYWFKEQLGAGIGMQRSKMTAEWQSDIETGEASTHKYTCSLNSYYTKLNYVVNYNFTPYVELNYNSYSEHYAKENFATDIKRGSGFGIVLGIKHNYFLAENLKLNVDTGYYLTEIQIKEKYSSYEKKIVKNKNEILQLKGLQIQAGISYNF